MKILVNFILCCIASLMAMTSCLDKSREDKMKDLLTQAEKKNMEYVSLASDNGMSEVLDYYMAHGNTDEKVRANYIMGSVFRDRSDAPRALSYYKDAIRIAVNDNNYIDNKKLSRIYGQISYLYNLQNSPSLERDAEHNAFHYAMLAKDTVAALMFYNRIADTYHMENKWDSAMIISEKTYKSFLSIGRKDFAAGTSTTMIDIFIRRKDFKRAKQLIDDYEMYSGLVENGKVAKGYEMFYARKGSYYMGVNKIDSAIFFYRNAACSHDILNNVVSGYKGLMVGYATLGVTDSVYKYCMLYEKHNDSLNISRASLEINKMCAVYDYSESQKQAFEKAMEAEKYKITLYISAVISIIIAISLLYTYRYITRKRKRELIDANVKYSETQYKYNSLLTELSSLKKDKDAYVKRKEQEVKNLREQLSMLVDDKMQLEIMDSEHDLLSCDIVQRFHSYASKGESPAASEWKALEKEVKYSMKNLCSLIYEPSFRLSSTDIRVCILLRLQFVTTEIASLLGLTKQRISNIKNRLNNVLFNSSGAKTLGKNIQNL